MLDLYDEFRSLIASLAEHGLDYALCGGLAMAVYGVPRATVDIDLLILAEDLGPVTKLAKSLGYVTEAAPMSFAEGTIEMRRISKADPESGDMLMLDLLLVTPAIRAAWDSRSEVEWEGGRLKVVARDGLIALKALRRSGQDMDDIKKLKESGDEG